MNLRESESGASLTEYALIFALVALVAIVALVAVGLSTRDSYEEVGDALVEGAPGETESTRNCDYLSFQRVVVQKDDLRIRVRNDAAHTVELVNMVINWHATPQQAPQLRLDKVCAHEKKDTVTCISFWGGTGKNRPRNYGIGGRHQPNGPFNAQELSAGYHGPYTLGGNGDITYFNLDWAGNPGNRPLSDFGYSVSSFSGSAFYFANGCVLELN